VAIRSLLLHLDATPASFERVDFAQALAGRQGAHLTAVFGVRPQASPATFAYSAGAALRAVDEGGVPHERQRARLRDLLAERAPGFVWCEVAGDSVGHGFVAEAIYADLLVLGPPPAPDSDGMAPAGFVESVILESGTPAIVVPYPHLQATVGERVLIAWNGSPAAARAMKAALPILQGAAEVRVATWTQTPPFAPFSRVDACAWLERHGIAARPHRGDPVHNVAGALGRLAADSNADLVVMGCYGHSRLREQVFGGATRSALAKLAVPILMAH
jgi:nucleotide-binding universal stress UspA family protein